MKRHEVVFRYFNDFQKSNLTFLSAEIDAEGIKIRRGYIVSGIVY